MTFCLEILSKIWPFLSLKPQEHGLQLYKEAILQYYKWDEGDQTKGKAALLPEEFGDGGHRLLLPEGACRCRVGGERLEDWRSAKKPQCPLSLKVASAIQDDMEKCWNWQRKFGRTISVNNAGIMDENDAGGSRRRSLGAVTPSTSWPSMPAAKRST